MKLGSCRHCNEQLAYVLWRRWGQPAAVCVKKLYGALYGGPGGARPVLIPLLVAGWLAPAGDLHCRPGSVG
jgi:hypothetical protein